MLPKTTDGLPSDSADCHQQENAVGERSQDGAATQSVGVPDTGSALSQDGGSPSQEKAQDVTQVMARIRNQSQRVRGQTKHHLGEHIDNVQRYADGKSFTESRRQVVRMLRTTVRTMTVRIFSCRMTRRTPAVAVAVARSLAYFSSQRRIRIFHRSRKNFRCRNRMPFTSNHTKAAPYHPERLRGCVFAIRNLSIQAAEAEVFHFEKLIDSVMRSFAAKSGLLHAAERHRLSGNQAGVDADHSVFQFLGDAPNSPDVATKKITGQTEFGVVGKLNGLLVFVKPEDRSNRSECFLPSNFHFGRYLCQDGRLKKCAAQAVPFAPEQHACALAHSIRDVILNLLHSILVNQRALHHVGFQSVADL